VRIGPLSFAAGFASWANPQNAKAIKTINNAVFFIALIFVQI
jgi:hypothetical protein